MFIVRRSNCYFAILRFGMDAGSYRNRKLDFNDLPGLFQDRRRVILSRIFCLN